MGVKCGVLFFYPFILILNSISSLFSNPDLPLSLCFIISAHYPGLRLANWWLPHPQKHFVKVPHGLLVPQPMACSPLCPGAVTPDMPLPATPLSCHAGCLPSRVSSSPNYSTLSSDPHKL